MGRIDISQYLVHWVRGDDFNLAFEIFRKIINERRILGTKNNIKGSFPCVCFTEAPENIFHRHTGRYKPFGIQVPKDWLFSLGGRPVIYETDEEYKLLPDQIKWRHVKYEPPSFDFTWEREWRIQIEELIIAPNYARLLVPHESWSKALIDEHEDYEKQYLNLLGYGEQYLGILDVTGEFFSCAVID